MYKAIIILVLSEFLRSKLLKLVFRRLVSEVLHTSLLVRVEEDIRLVLVLRNSVAELKAIVWIIEVAPQKGSFHSRLVLLTFALGPSGIVVKLNSATALFLNDLGIPKVTYLLQFLLTLLQPLRILETVLAAFACNQFLFLIVSQGFLKRLYTLLGPSWLAATVT